MKIIFINNILDSYYIWQNTYDKRYKIVKEDLR